MSGEVGQWDLESLCCFFPLLLSSPSLLLVLSCQWKMSNAIKREEDDELLSGKRANEKEKDRQRGGLGLTRVPHQLTETPRQRKRERKREERDLYLRSRGKEWLMSLHLDIETTI